MEWLTEGSVEDLKGEVLMIAKPSLGLMNVPHHLKTQVREQNFPIGISFDMIM